MSVSEPLTLFPEDSLVSHSPLQENAKAKATQETYGEKCLESFAKLNHDGSWLKTYQGCCQHLMDGSLEKWLETWPRAGTVLNGIAYRLPPLAHLTDEIEYGLWLTPMASDSSNREMSVNSRGEPKLSGQVKIYPEGKPEKTQQQKHKAKMWPTPQSRDYKGTSQRFSHGNKTDCLPNAIGGSLNPTFVEWLMGCPTGWTNLNCSATAKSFRLSNGSEKE